MNSERQQAYLNLISQLLNCDSGDEAEILKTHPELLDDGLVVAMLEEADNLREQGKLNNANWLKNFAGLLGKVDGDFLAGIALKAEADRLLEQGDRQYDISQFREALQFDEQALTIYREIRDRQGEAYCLNNLGLVYYSLGQYDKAIEFHQQYLEISREIEYRQGEANSLNSLGLAYKSLGQFHRAIEFHQQSLEISREIGYRQGEAYCLNNLGLVYYSLWQFQRAIEFHQQSLEIKREIGNHQGEAASLSSLGNAYDSLGQFERAIEFHQQSLEIEREIEYRQGEADSLGNLGNAYQALGQFQQAIEFHQQSLEIEREIEYRQGEAASLGNLGLAYDSLGQFERAIEFNQQSLEIEREIGNRLGEAASLGNLGNAYQSLGQFQRAIEFHQQSLEIKREIGNRQGEANALGNLGNAYKSLGQFQQAIEFHQQSLEIEREIEDRVGESISLNNLGYTFLKINQLVEAETALCASIAIHETVRSELVNNDHKASIFETQLSPYQNLQQVLVAQTKFDEALEISEMSRTRAFVELLQQTLLTNDVPTNNETNKLSIPKIQQIARDRNSTIVEYSIIDSDIIYIWVIQPNGNITHRAANLEPLNQQNQTLKQIILKTRVSIGTVETDDAGNKIQPKSQYNRDETGRFPLLQLLHQILIEPIIDLLPTDANSPIIFIPHYDLFLVPFAALQSGNNRYLIENHTILTSPSIQVLELTRQHQNRVRGLRQAALIVGDPTIHPNFQLDPHKLRQIPRAKEAAEAIAATLQTQAISGDNATKVAILDRMLNTRIVHLSAHGLIDDFQGSGIPGAIILAPSGEDDGAIHAVDILQLKLDSELVVLSACSTGRGKITGDGVIGLSRCFILAGVPSIIVSLWNMGVISAKLLMTEFYQNLARGDNRAAALRCAMLTTKARFPSPIAWAAFTLIGETEILPLSTAKIDLRSLKMSLPDDAKPEEIVAAFSKLLKISEPQFVAELSAIDVGAMDNVNVIAERIKDWCESRPQIEENLENEIYQMGAGGTDSHAPEEVVREFYETLKKNKIRLGLSRDSVVVENPAVETAATQTMSASADEDGPGGG
ncbi:MAG: tetratricopeptide repeat protein [Microcoleus sp. PH2017_40_RAT_O_B]|uniref:CHAT domain-containing protein n=1 Tax=unclassified Microcoleus TaxID=2642155 RepID=UPI001D6AECA0|nr:MULTISPECIES: CHAT domain-containing tetratricopeptide repeat protein [unclassified Microcoleus]MCC3575875.1 tetratricopeptide repeat protein [Microcoleus sp. PH2017_34_RAT_O_A]MCC3613592.1 tetratricopeptide repeat protein [Microcoleus sp. PH2017_40_RAT_O_B]